MSEQSQNGLKVLLAGVPFGRDNVGDEAILECVVNIVRELAPAADIAASTDDQEATGRKLSIRTKPLFGFEPPGFSEVEMRAAIDECDAFIWSGATGLSDYPNIPLGMLQYAADQGKKTAIFCTGMNSELNPYLYQLMPGKRRSAYEALKAISLGTVDLTAKFEHERREATRRRMRRALNAADLVVLRDKESHKAVEGFIGLPEGALVGADPAITLDPLPIADAKFHDSVKALCADSSKKKVGLCVSAQSPVKELGEMRAMFNDLIAKDEVVVVGIPMNPITDAKLMKDFGQSLDRPEAMRVAEGRFEPDAIAGLAAEMDVVISSRLHLLILAATSFTPIIGISRGSKVTNFTGQFDLPNLGSVDEMDFDGLAAEIRRLIAEKGAFAEKARTVRGEMMGRLDAAKAALKSLLERE